MSSNVEFSTLKKLSRRIKHYRAKQRYRANFLRFFWPDNVLPGVVDMIYYPNIIEWPRHKDINGP